MSASKSSFQKTITPGMLPAIILIAILSAIAAGFADIPAIPFLNGISVSSPSEEAGTLIPQVSSGHHTIITTDFRSIALMISLVALCSAGIYLLNKKFNPVKGSEPLWSTIFLLLNCANPCILPRLSPSLPIALLLILCMGILFSNYRNSNASIPIFTAASFGSIGLMFQWALLPYVLALPFCAATMKCLHFRQIMAYLLGLMAPFWIGIGFGWLNPLEFRAPGFYPVVATPESLPGLIIILGLSLLLLATMIVTANNLMNLYAGNTAVRLRNNVVNIIGLAALAGIFSGISGWEAHLSALMIWVAMQLANAFVLWKLPRPRLLYWILATLCLAFSVLLAAATLIG